jgi:hypothetical protein
MYKETVSEIAVQIFVYGNTSLNLKLGKIIRPEYGFEDFRIFNVNVGLSWKIQSVWPH